jgi:hypothetical protein
VPRRNRGRGVWGSAPPGTRTLNPLIKSWLSFNGAPTCENGGSRASIIPQLSCRSMALKRVTICSPASRRRRLTGPTTCNDTQQAPTPPILATRPLRRSHSLSRHALLSIIEIKVGEQCTRVLHWPTDRFTFNRALSGRGAWSSRSPQPAWRGTLAHRTDAGPTGKQDLQPVEQLPQAQADAAGFGWRSRSRVRKPCATETRVTWWCQPAQERPSKWSSPSAPLSSR